MTHHPEGVFIRDAAGKTPMDYAKDLPAHRKLEVVKALKQGSLLSAVSRAAMQRAATTETIRHRQDAPVDSASTALIEAQVKAAKAETEKTYATIVAKMKAEHKRQIMEAKAETESERKAKADLELKFEAELGAAKEEAEKRGEELTVSSRKVEELTHNDCLSVSTLPLRQKLKSVRAELEQEWENNSKLIEENKTLKESNAKLESEVDDQKKIMEAIKENLVTKMEELDSNEATISDLKNDIAEKAALLTEFKVELADVKNEIESKISTINERETAVSELTEKNNELEEVKSRLQIATEEILSKASKITDLELRYIEKEAHCGDLSKELDELKPKLESEAERCTTLAENVSELETRKTGLELELAEAIKGLEMTKEKLVEATNDVEAKTSKISELESVRVRVDALRLEHKNEQHRAEALEEKVQTLEADKAQLEGEVAGKAEDVDKTKSRLFDLTEELEAKSSTINGLEVLLANEESRCEDLNTELEGVKTELETSQTQVASLTENVSKLTATKESLELDLEVKAATLKETETTLDLIKEEKESKIAENTTLDALLFDTYDEIKQIKAQLEKKQAQAERAVVLEQEVDKTTNELLMASARSDELQLNIAQLNNKLASTHLEIKKYKMRAKTVEKWVSSFALSIQGWRLEQDNPEDLLIVESSTDLIAEMDEKEN